MESIYTWFCSLLICYSYYPLDHAIISNCLLILVYFRHPTTNFCVLCPITLICFSFPMICMDQGCFCYPDGCLWCFGCVWVWYAAVVTLPKHRPYHTWHVYTETASLSSNWSSETSSPWILHITQPLPS